mmetsp:Transcript_1263/g.3661  ORF Transcript_1263/g.3661 Transcript_1263/m.3661 type:complete len:154 (+) Transcript_1263:807-1268(+)
MRLLARVYERCQSLVVEIVDGLLGRGTTERRRRGRRRNSREVRTPWSRRPSVDRPLIDAARTRQAAGFVEGRSSTWRGPTRRPGSSMGRSSTWHGPHRRRTAPRTSSDGGDAAADALALRGQACTKQQACAGRKTSTDPAARRPASLYRVRGN